MSKRKRDQRAQAAFRPHVSRLTANGYSGGRRLHGMPADLHSSGGSGMALGHRSFRSTCCPIRATEPWTAGAPTALGDSVLVGWDLEVE